MHIGNDNRDIDVCAVYQGILDNGNMDHELRSDVLYTEHRKGAWDTFYHGDIDRHIDQAIIESFRECEKPSVVRQKIGGKQWA